MRMQQYIGGGLPRTADRRAKRAACAQQLHPISLAHGMQAISGRPLVNVLLPLLLALTPAGNAEKGIAASTHSSKRGVVAGGAGRRDDTKLDCLFGVNVHMYTGLYSNLSTGIKAHLGTAVTSLYGLGHGSGNHAPTPAGSVDFIDHPTQLFQPNSSYWQEAWNKTLSSAPGYMAAYVLAELRKDPNPNTNSTRPSAGVVMLDYEPAFRPSWSFQTSARPDTRWEALLQAVHTPTLDLNWTSLVGWSGGEGQPAGVGWGALSNAQQDSLMAQSWNYFCREYLSAGMDAIRAALQPSSAKLSVWNWPFKMGGSTAQNATALHEFEKMIAEMDWLWQKLDLFLPDVYPEFYVGTAQTMPSVLSKCTVPRGCALGSDGCTVANKSYADLYFSANIAHMQRVRQRCHPTAKIYLSTWWHCEYNSCLLYLTKSTSPWQWTDRSRLQICARKRC